MEPKDKGRRWRAKDANPEAGNWIPQEFIQATPPATVRLRSSKGYRRLEVDFLRLFQPEPARMVGRGE